MAFPSEAEIRELPAEERLRLIELLWGTFVADPASLPVTQAQAAELQRRVAEHDANPGDARPWPKVREELERD